MRRVIVTTTLVLAFAGAMIGRAHAAAIAPDGRLGRPFRMARLAQTCSPPAGGSSAQAKPAGS